MKLEDISNIYVGSDSVSKIYLGNTEVWPLTPSVPPPDDVQYNNSASPNSDWGNSIQDGSDVTLIDNHWMSCYRYIDQYGRECVASQYDWNMTGDASLIDTWTLTPEENQFTSVGAYRYRFGGEEAKLSLTDPVTGRRLFHCTFNKLQKPYVMTTAQELMSLNNISSGSVLSDGTVLSTNDQNVSIIVHTTGTTTVLKLYNTNDVYTGRLYSGGSANYSIEFVATTGYIKKVVFQAQSSNYMGGGLNGTNVTITSDPDNLTVTCKPSGLAKSSLKIWNANSPQLRFTSIKVYTSTTQ